MYEDESIKNIIVFGDWHGNGRYATDQMNKISSENRIPDVYLHVGDFGIWSWSASFILDLERSLALQGRELWFVDGNHEDFNMLEAYPFDERGLQKVTKHIFHIPRGYAWRWANKTFVGLGGAFSVDMRKLTTGVNWFPQELITDEDFNKAISHGSADVLVSHEGPWIPRGWSSNKANALGFTLTPEEEYYGKTQRDYIARAINSLGVKLNLHGHHHTAYVEDFFGTQVIGLNKDNRSFDENAIEVDLNAL